MKIKLRNRSLLSWMGAQPCAPTFLIALFFISGCSKYYYNPAPQVLPQHIQKLAIRPFANHTQQYGLEDKLTLAVQNEFNRDGRYSITTEDQADGVVIADITKYILEPQSFDSNHVPTQYKLWILLDLTFYDKVRNLTLFKETNMSGQLIYYVTSSNQPGSLTEDDARETIFDQLARDIRTRTLEGFGTVTGASDRAVPGTSLDKINSLPGAPDNTPPPVPPQNPSGAQSSVPY